jgi:uncharacterized protein
MRPAERTLQSLASQGIRRMRSTPQRNEVILMNGNEARTRGFASMDRARQKEIASMGGRAAHRQGMAHQFTPEEARAAGRKGGEAVSANRAHMALIGRRGGEASRRRTALRSPGETSARSTRNDVERAANGAGHGAGNGAGARSVSNGVDAADGSGF